MKETNRTSESKSIKRMYNKINKVKNELVLPYADKPGLCNHCGKDITKPITYNGITYSARRFFCPKCSIDKIEHESGHGNRYKVHTIFNHGVFKY